MCGREIPEDAIGPGTYYHQQELPPLGEYLEIYVSNVVSPGLFWFQLRGKHTSLALEKVMNQLEWVLNVVVSIRNLKVISKTM